MGAARFENFVRSLSAKASRRRLPGLAALGLTALPLGTLAARKRRMRKKRTRPKVVLNEFGCVDVGGACRGNDALCCSGICEGKKPKQGKRDKSRCVAHNAQDCQAGRDACLGENFEPCGRNGDGFCVRTTGNANFCATVGGGCFACRRDVDCEPILGRGAACVLCASCVDAGGTACQPAAS